MNVRGTAFGVVWLAVLVGACRADRSDSAVDAGSEAGADAGPASTCALAWFKCPEVCPNKLMLRGGGRRYPECLNDCDFMLSMGPGFVLDEGGCVEMRGSLDVQGPAGAVRIVNFALTDAAWEQATLISVTLGASEPPAVTPCPECADQPSAWLGLGEAGADAELATYLLGQPPDALRAADAFVQALIDQARGCKGELLSGCQSVDAATGAPSAPACGGEPLSAVACQCPGDVFELDGAACDGSCGSCWAQGTCGAHCTDPCSGGGGTPRWSVWCTE